MSNNFENVTNVAFAPARRYYLYCQGDLLVSANLLTGEVFTGAGERKVDWPAANAIEQYYQQTIAAQENSIIEKMAGIARCKCGGRSESGTTFLFSSVDCKHHFAEIDWHWRAVQFEGVWYRSDTLFDRICALVDNLPLNSRF